MKIATIHFLTAEMAAWSGSRLTLTPMEVIFSQVSVAAISPQLRRTSLWFVCYQGFSGGHFPFCFWLGHTATQV
jgi:hypothetical protein